MLRALKKWAHLVPEIRLAAPDARMASLDRPAGAIVELGSGTIIEGIWTLASHFVQAVTHFGLFRAEFCDELAILEVTSSWTLIMNRFPVSKEGTAFGVKIRQFAQQDVVYYRTHKVDRVGRTSCDIDGLDPDSLAYTLVSAGVRGCFLDTAVAGAST